MSREDQKRAAAEAAVSRVKDGMVVGLGTGSTAAYAIDALALRVRNGTHILGIPTSERSAAQAREGGISLTTFSACRSIDLTIDGADAIAPESLNLIKGLGGALLREKIVAAASKRLIIVADDAKIVDRLGATTPVPIEVVPFGWETTAERIARLGCKPVLRIDALGQPFRTDGGNMILDCEFGPIADAAAVDAAMSQIIGVVETGLFIGMAQEALVADETGVRSLECKMRGSAH